MLLDSLHTSFKFLSYIKIVNYFLVAYLSLILGGQTARAGLISLGHEWENTSDDFARQTSFVLYESCRRDLFWPYEKECSENLSWGLFAKRHEVSIPGQRGVGLKEGLKASWRASEDLNLRLEVARHALDVAPLFPVTSLGVGLTQMDWKVTSNLDLSLIAERDFVYPEMRLPSAFSEALSAWSFQVNSLYRWEDLWRIGTRIKALSFSDQNSSQEYDLSGLYGIAPGTPWVWFGLGFNQLSFDQEKPGYWTPSRVTSYGPRLEFDFPLGFGSQSSFFGGINFNRIQEQNLDEAEGYVGSLGFKFGQRHRMNFRLTYQRVQTTQKGRSWISDLVSAEIHGI